MKIKVKMLIVMSVLMLATPWGAQLAMAEEQNPYVQAEPSDKRGLQKEDGEIFYYEDDGYRATGWKKIKKKIYYFRTEGTEAPIGSALTDLQTVDSHSYYFDEEGVLQTGWQTIDGSRYYFATTGVLGEIGQMYVGLQTIGAYRYFFDPDGEMRTGWVNYSGKNYYFTKKKTSEQYGAAYTGWQTIGKEQYYFSAKGVMKRNRWISKRYYVDDDGRMLKSCVTPDGYLVDASGQKLRIANGFVKVAGKMYYYLNGEKTVGFKWINGKLYYFKPNGTLKARGWLTIGKKKYYIQNAVVQTGWHICDGARFYFNTNGKMVKNKTVDGVPIGEDGKAPISVLLISGHGQGDPGATQAYGSTVYREDLLTREFSTWIYKYLEVLAPELNVVMFDQNYDCFQILAGRKTGPRPNFKAYDYVLEIHFNATGAANKDVTGNGSCKGVSMYVNSAKTDTTIDKMIVAALSRAVNFPIRTGGDGISYSSGLLNARTIQGQGVSYGLLETAFIDDRDDMNVYNSKKYVMAKAVATAIKEYFGTLG